MQAQLLCQTAPPCPMPAWLFKAYKAKVLEQLLTGWETPQLSWPRNAGCDCSLLITPSLDVSCPTALPSPRGMRDSTASFSLVWLIEGLWMETLQRTFYASPIQGVPQICLCRGASYKTVCFFFFFKEFSWLCLRIYLNILCFPPFKLVYFVL